MSITTDTMSGIFAIPPVEDTPAPSNDPHVLAEQLRRAALQDIVEHLTGPTGRLGRLLPDDPKRQRTWATPVQVEAVSLLLGADWRTEPHPAVDRLRAALRRGARLARILPST